MSTTERPPYDPTKLASTAAGDHTLADLLVRAWDSAAMAGMAGKKDWSKEAQAAQLEAVCRYVDRLHALIRWFDIAYGDNVPVWLTENMYGQPLPENVELMETYRGVIGDKGAVPID